LKKSIIRSTKPVLDVGLVIEVECGNMSLNEAKQRFNFSSNFDKIFRDWQLRYSSKIHLSLQTMTPEELTNFKMLQERIKELEEQLERSEIKNVLTETMIDVAEEMFKIDIRKKHSAKQ